MNRNEILKRKKLELKHVTNGNFKKLELALHYSTQLDFT